ncbi:uncharacterized protein LOC125235798 [Leguminivora glycinivorella]|uniref:uncharacterized protein LOC125235798 n=1 Tax=Leguminivora glycinivorella TaxID=1035111 RepID=UPI00200E7794|nr:uncharacterized protein LOC125235798 [Leguminivora glycinivorella]
MLAANRDQIRLQVIDLHEQGVGIREISRQINVTRNTVRRWVRRHGNEENIIDLRRNNHRPQVITQEQSRLMQMQYIMDAFTPTRHFAEAFEVHPSTIRRHLHAMGVHHRRPAKKIALTDAHKAARLIFARRYLNFDWTTTAFIDEKTFQSSQTGRLHLWRIDRTRYTEDHVLANNASGRITVNMSGWISSAGIGELVDLPPRATAQEYVDLLDETRNVIVTLMTNSKKRNPITVDGQPIHYVDEYIYLGQLVSFSNRQDKEIERRVGNAWKSYWSMKELMKGNLPLSLKRKLVDMCILPVLTYGAQTWSLTESQKSKLKVCQRDIERSILGVKRTDRIRNTTLRSKTRIADVGERTARLKWDWAGHVCRMHPDRWASLAGMTTETPVALE